MSRMGETGTLGHGQRRARKVFTSDEDAKLIEIMRLQQFTSWEKVAKDLPDRTARQCRDRWLNYLSPNIRKDPWLWAEDKLLVEKINEMGTHWSNIAKYFVGRSDNHLKNRWYSYLRNRVVFDPSGRYVLVDHPPAEHAATMSTEQVIPLATSIAPDADFWDLRLLHPNAKGQQPIFSACGGIPEFPLDVFSIL